MRSGNDPKGRSILKQKAASARSNYKKTLASRATTNARINAKLSKASKKRTKSK